MTLEHLQVWFYARPRMFCEPVNALFLGAFDELVGPQGCVELKS